MSNRKTYKVLSAVLTLVLLLALVITGCTKETTTTPTTTTPTTTTTAPAPEVKHIKIGTIMGLTGPLSIPSIAFNRGWDLYSDDLKAQGGIKIGNDHYVFDFIYEDSKGSAEGAGTAANKLVFQDGVKFIIGGMLESELEAIYQVTASQDVLFAMANINIPGHPADVGADKPLMVRLSVNPDDNQPVDLDYLLEAYPAAKTIAVSAPDIGYEGMIAALESQAAERGLSVSFVEKWAWGTTDFIPTFTRILASNPDVVFAMNSGQAMDQLIAARQLGFDGPFISNSPLGADVFVMVVQDPVMLTDVLVNSPDVFHPADATMIGLMDRWAVKYGNEPFVSDCLHSYDMPWILAQAMEKAQSIDPAEVLAALETMTADGSLEINFGSARMGGADTYGVNRVLYRPFPLTRIMNGETEFIGNLTP